MGRNVLTDTAATPRQRAPRRRGHRTQLTVPHELWAAAEELAEEMGTTPNDVVVRLAEKGLGWIERQAEIDAIAEARWDAHRRRRRGRRTGELPSEEEVLALVLSDED